MVEEIICEIHLRMVNSIIRCWYYMKNLNDQSTKLPFGGAVVDSVSEGMDFNGIMKTELTQ